MTAEMSFFVPRTLSDATVMLRRFGSSSMKPTASSADWLRSRSRAMSVPASPAPTMSARWLTAPCLCRLTAARRHAARIPVMNMSARSMDIRNDERGTLTMRTK